VFSFIKHALRIIVFFVVSLHAQATLTVDGINNPYFFNGHLSSFIDESGVLSFEEVRQRSFTDVAHKSIALGFVSHPVWLKAEFITTAHTTISDALLILTAPVMDYVDVYLVDANGDTQIFRAGDQLLTGNNSLTLRMPVFSLSQLAPNTRYVIYMRLQTAHNAFYVEPKLSNISAWEQQNMVDLFVLAIALAVMSIVIVMALISWLMFKRRAHMHMVLFSVLILCTFLLPNGWLNILLPIGWADIGNVMIQGMMPVPALYIAISMLQLKKHLPKVLRIQFVLTWLIFVVSIWAALTDNHTYSLSLTQPGVLMLIVIMIAESIFLYQKEKVAKHFLFMFIGMIVALAIRYASIHGFVPINFLTTNLPVFTGLLMALFLYYSLALSLRQSEDGQLISRMKTRQLEQTSEKRKLFINMMAHELNTPLAIVEAALSNLARTLHHPEDAQIRIDKVQKNLQHMSKVIELCLMNERLTTTDNMPTKPVSIGMLMQIVDEHLQLIQDTKRLRFVQSVSPSLMIAMDPAMLSIALVNVIDNALKYSPPSCIVVVTYRCDDAYVYVDVVDQGSGFEEDSQANTLVERKHLGIGLLITQQIIALHHGSIVFKTASKGGGSVSITLPLSI
jgi:signal transduction histidine kinase